MSKPDLRSQELIDELTKDHSLAHRVLSRRHRQGCNRALGDEFQGFCLGCCLVKKTRSDSRNAKNSFQVFTKSRLDVAPDSHERHLVQIRDLDSRFFGEPMMFR